MVFITFIGKFVECLHLLGIARCVGKAVYKDSKYVQCMLGSERATIVEDTCCHEYDFVDTRILIEKE